MSTIITGGAGFIGSELARQLVTEGRGVVWVLDKLTYAANPHALPDEGKGERCQLVEVDIADSEALGDVIDRLRPRRIYHLAAESHVDRSIHASEDFIRTNVLGTHALLEASRRLQERDSGFRFLHVSSDEVYGALGEGEPAFRVDSPYRPNSPYSASKAASDHLVRAWHKTYGLSVVTTHCTNNYGPWQNGEKLIPRMILRALQGEALPVYGDGRHRRDWLHVADHARGLRLAMERGETGAVYNFAGGEERRNIDLVRDICACLDRLKPKARGRYESQIAFVDDRPGHDFRYAVDDSETRVRLDWAPQIGLGRGLADTVAWYLGEWR